MARDMLSHELRDGSAYRADRLRTEQARIERRLWWAEERGDREAVRWLESRLDELEEALQADLAPGREPGRLG